MSTSFRNDVLLCTQRPSPRRYGFYSEHDVEEMTHDDSKMLYSRHCFKMDTRIGTYAYGAMIWVYSSSSPMYAFSSS
ncbi:hypothetical protein CC85DRAFT_284108 [Cutaneotrichosporon oleaginosum]|uniref:Uncharacterized protein n=1 Tax=Cutaneotrichosporon oleaginosum TaxID=879819 RepID=A0A0J0XRX6_9TREE|nr:uncharacterized protein CC85DRAFT_284108 [Cutaneotrichosporon oleaginosum]KLT43825.1 hypothetical protein CC85DRAFT_284108 [Cutaneotrichosporon oleaginosum]TXT06433.1 hypothetical protein COLE_05764 [Cutaneotrichosporon oleaginosum]